MLLYLQVGKTVAININHSVTIFVIKGYTKVKTIYYNFVLTLIANKIQYGPLINVTETTVTTNQ